MAEKEVGQLKATVSLTTTEFNKGIESLSKQMSIAREEFKQASTGLDKVKDAMQIAQLRAKSLTEQIEIQKKIVAQMAEAHKYAAERFGEGSDQAVKYELKLAKAETTLGKLENALKNTNKELKSHGLISAETTDKIKAMGEMSEKVGQKMTDIGKKLSVGVTAPIIALATGIAKLTTETSEYADEIGILSDKTGMSTKSLQEMKYITNQLDVDFGVIGTSTSSFTLRLKGLEEGSGDAVKSIKALGIETEDTAGKTRPINEIYMDTIAKLSEMKNVSDRNIEASKIFGKSWAELAPLLNAGGDEIERLRARANELGLVMGEEALDSARDYGDQMDELKMQFQGSFREISLNFIPIIKDKLVPFIQTNVIPALKEFGSKIAGIIDWFESLDTSTQKTIGIIAGIAVAIGPVLVLIGKLTTGIKSLTTAFTFLMAHPIILAIAGIAAAIGLIIYAANSADRAVQKMTASLISSYQEEAEKQKAAIDEAYAVKIASISGQLAAEEDASGKRLEVIQAEYEAEIKGATKKEQELKKNLQARQSTLEKAHSVAIKQIQEEYGVFEEKTKSKTQIVQDEANEQKDIINTVLALSKDIATQEGDAFNKTYDAILAKASEVHDEKIRMYNEEYLKSVSLINQDLAAKVKVFQDEIAEIQNKTKEEDRIKKEQDDANKIIDLQARIDAATTDAEREKANQDLADEINRQNREKELENRKIQIESLNDQIKTATEKANEEKNNALITLNEKVGEQQLVIDADTKHKIDQIQAEREAKEKAETAKYNAAKSALDQEEKDLDGFAEFYKTHLDKELALKQRVEANKLKAVTDRINAELAAEEKKATGEKEAVDKATTVKIDTAYLDSLRAEILAIKNKDFLHKDIVMDTIKINELQNKIDAEIVRLDSLANPNPFGTNPVPKFASGITDWRGGLARINEEGGEIRYLERGTTVIPNDISIQIAKSIGAAIGSAGRNPEIHLHIGTYIGDDYSLKQLERKLKNYRILEDSRLGALA